MEIYSRKKSVEINLAGPDRLSVNAVFKDSVHEIRVRIMVGFPEMVIRDAQVEFVSCPWDLCYEAAGVMSRLVGLKLGRGIRKTVKEAVAGSDGCSHLGELMSEVMQALMQAHYRTQLYLLDPEERAQATISTLKGTCRAFSDPERQPVPLGNWTTMQSEKSMEEI
ncbi:MAG: DUF2889 domain-containing protein [Firmicutes bacterium]|nr:DUF2889 domain-containing protein [Bacillota bacterium]